MTILHVIRWANDFNQTFFRIKYFHSNKYGAKFILEKLSEESGLFEEVKYFYCKHFNLEEIFKYIRMTTLGSGESWIFVILENDQELLNKVTLIKKHSNGVDMKKFIDVFNSYACNTLKFDDKEQSKFLEKLLSK